MKSIAGALLYKKQGVFVVRFMDRTEQAFMGPINLSVVERASKGVPPNTAGTLGELQDGHGHNTPILSGPPFTIEETEDAFPAEKFTPDLESSLERFVYAFEAVFDNDWEFTKTALGGDGIHHLVPGKSFLEPGVEDEGNNWGNRGALLRAYRELLAAMAQRGIKIERP